jgi:hypothetical protein
LGNKGDQFGDFVCDGCEIDCDGSDGSLEFSVFGVQGINSLLKGSNVFSFSGSEVIQGINDGVSEFV